MQNPHEIDDDILILYDDIDLTPPSTPDYAVYLDEGCDIFGLPLKPSQEKPTPSTSKKEATPGTSRDNQSCQCPECARSRLPQTSATSEVTPGPSKSSQPCDCPECRRPQSPQAPTTSVVTPGTSSDNKPCECPECANQGPLQQSTTREPGIYERPLPVPELHQPAIINGAKVYSLQSLRPTTNLSELRMRSANSHQLFITREKQRLYLSRDIIKRIDFEAIMKRKHKEKTINLPARHQVRLRVRADGVIIFHHYHKRGIGKGRQILNEPFNRGENVDVPKKKTN